MDLDVVGSDQLTSLLNTWNQYIRTSEIERAEQVRKNVQNKLSSIEENQSKFIDYLLLEFRHQLLQKNSEEITSLLPKVESYQTEMDGLQTFYFFFLKGIYLYNTRNYEAALENYELAEKKLSFVSDDVERAEFYYKLASVYCELGQSFLSATHAKTAFDLFQKNNEFLKRSSHCELLLGLNCVEMKQFEQAEVQFHSALNYANKTEDVNLKSHIYHNLGYLYAEQNLSDAAVRYLKLALENQDHENYVAALYLLTREQFKLKNVEQATKNCSKGIELCTRENNIEYLTHFKLLNALNSELTENFEITFKEGISYFVKEKLWVYVQEYAEYLADFYNKLERYKEACHYFDLSIKSRKEIFEKEALK
ncbi:RapH N-terminal domain-containing protein [Fictibacillus gelatini]|uniref:response regulator aspartate phosphatase n=1 Tax=Fictibacillus gelatini TaxID=225985 RepID=UPI00041AF9D9|nr:RapH N-terminal domain-containing protein [Fictibacillus gelatini]